MKVSIIRGGGGKTTLGAQHTTVLESSLDQLIILLLKQHLCRSCRGVSIIINRFLKIKIE